jgi:DNA-directed RNA polymerase specialized sigma24 family protein
VEGGTAADLVRRARDGDRDAWAGLVERYLGLVHAVCRAHRLEGDDAAAVNRVVWLRLGEQLLRLRAPEAVGAWIAAAARSECLRALGAAGRIVHPGDEIGPPGAGVCAAGGDAGPVVAEAVAAGAAEADADAEANAGAEAPAGEDPQVTARRDLLAAFGALDTGSQRLLRVLASAPRPGADEVGAALDLPAEGVALARDRSLGHLRAAVVAGAGR